MFYLIMQAWAKRRETQNSAFENWKLHTVPKKRKQKENKQKRTSKRKQAKTSKNKRNERIQRGRWSRLFLG
jgi:hypothetical protein